MGWFVRKGGKWENRTGPHEEMGKEIHSMGRWVGKQNWNTVKEIEKDELVWNENRKTTHEEMEKEMTPQEDEQVSRNEIIRNWERWAGLWKEKENRMRIWAIRESGKRNWLDWRMCSKWKWVMIKEREKMTWRKIRWGYGKVLKLYKKMGTWRWVIVKERERWAGLWWKGENKMRKWEVI